MSTAWNRGGSCSVERGFDSKPWHTCKTVIYLPCPLPLRKPFGTSAFLLLVLFLVLSAQLGYEGDAYGESSVNSWLAALLLILSGSPSAESAVDRQTVVVVVVLPVKNSMGSSFRNGRSVCARLRRRRRPTTWRLVESRSLRSRTRTDGAVLEASAKESLEPLWLVLIGHGTFDGRSAKFNLQGSDLIATDLAEWLKPFRRPLAVVNFAGERSFCQPAIRRGTRHSDGHQERTRAELRALWGTRLWHDCRRECGPGQGRPDVAAGSVRGSFVASRRYTISRGGWPASMR